MLNHVDWAISREDAPREIELMGREIERMDREMAVIHTEIQTLQSGRFNLEAMIPMQGIKTLK